VKKKGENVAHAQDGTRPKKLKNSGACGIRHPHAPAPRQAGVRRPARSVLAPVGRAPHSRIPRDDRGLEGEHSAFRTKDKAMTNCHGTFE
jgi:hypothetical protein